MPIPKNAKAIVAANDDGQGLDLMLLKIPRGKKTDIYYDGIRAYCKFYPRNSRVTLGDQGRYDYYAFFLGDDSSEMLGSYFHIEY